MISNLGIAARIAAVPFDGSSGDPGSYDRSGVGESFPGGVEQIPTPADPLTDAPLDFGPPGTESGLENSIPSCPASTNLSSRIRCRRCDKLICTRLHLRRIC